jgi:hypothetical protein
MVDEDKKSNVGSLIEAVQQNVAALTPRDRVLIYIAELDMVFEPMGTGLISLDERTDVTTPEGKQEEKVEQVSALIFVCGLQEATVAPAVTKFMVTEGMVPANYVDHELQLHARQVKFRRMAIATLKMASNSRVKVVGADPGIDEQSTQLHLPGVDKVQ